MSPQRRNPLARIDVPSLSIENPRLILEHFLPFGPGEELVAGRDAALEAITGRPPGGLDLYHLAFERWCDAVSRLPHVVSFDALAKGGVVAGRSSASVNEFSVFLDPVYGMPRLPGTSLKGIARAAAAAILDPDVVRDGFGNEPGALAAFQGHIRFFDAWWDPTTRIKNPFVRATDTVHHKVHNDRGGRPSGKSPAPGPWDFDDPVPLPYVSVTGTFLVAVQGPNQDWAELGADLLAKALAERHAGSKTAADYGRFERLPGNTLVDAATEAASAAEGLDEVAQAVLELAKSIQHWGNLKEVRPVLERCLELADGPAKAQVARYLADRCTGGVRQVALFRRIQELAQP